MANPLEHLAQNLAANLALLRKQRTLSQEALAKLSQVPRSTITYLESGAGNPSLQNLAKIAQALQVPLEELLSPPRSNCKLVKQNAVPRVKRANGNATLFKLLPDRLPGMEIDRLELKPGARMGGMPHVAGTKEYLTCVKGRVDVRVARNCYRVEAGDVLAFPGDQSHSYENSGTELAVCFSVVALAQLV